MVMEQNEKGSKCPSCGRFIKKLEAMCPYCGARPVDLPEDAREKEK